MNVKNILSFLGTLLVLALVIMGVIKVWIPEAIADDTFVKMVITFGILALGSMAVNFLRRGGK
jgi:protein-S-isoprenylcysteine O-methyltransferase Ste14